MNRLRLVFALLLAITCATSFAQKESLLIGPGDLISIQVLEAPELKQDVRVTDAGTISLLLGGEVKVEGLTPAEASRAIEKVLADGQYILRPHATVTVLEFATTKVTLIGQVRNPGSYNISTPRTVLDILALGGGVTDLADREITIERRGSKEKVEYFLSNTSSEALDKNVMVNPGDTVVVPKVNVVYVMGDVPRPGGFAMATNDGKLSLLQAVALAGSHEPHAVQDHTKLIRKKPDGTYVEMQVALGKIETGKQPDFLLQPDDIVYVPFSYLKNMGESLGSMISAAGTATIYRY